MIVLQVIGRALVRLVAMLLFLLIRSRRAVVAVAAVFVVGWVLLANVSRLPIPSGVLPAFLVGGGGAPVREVRTTRAAGAITVEQVPAVDSYIKGLTEFDARLMWSALAEEAINAMQLRGGSLEALQSGLDDAKQRGARYEDVTMIGTYPLQDGRKYLFYVLSRRGFSGTDQLEQVYFVFTVDRDGKITRIE